VLADVGKERLVGRDLVVRPEIALTEADLVQDPLGLSGEPVGKVFDFGEAPSADSTRPGLPFI
jgi:hypothetical protein